MDEPYEIKTCGRLIVGHSAPKKGRERTIVGGILLDNLIQGECPDYELWDVELVIRVRRKHSGSPLKGAKIDSQMVVALNYPETWEKKTFDTLKVKTKSNENTTRSVKQPKRAPKK